MSRFIERSLAPVLERALGEFPAIVLTGPRQSGKTTLLKRLFGKTHRYVSLEAPDVRRAAHSDPRGFLALNGPPVIFDEIQHAPDLLPYVKEEIDRRRSEKGRFVVTGSQNLLLLETVTETLAGRAAVLNLLPLSEREAAGEAAAALPWEKNKAGEARPKSSHAALWERFLRGSYPELVAEPKRDAALWHSSYLRTYLERDVRSLRQLGDLNLFQSFLRALAARNGGLLSLSDLGRDLGIAVNTVKAWLSVLEATFQIWILRPFHTNLGKRLVKAPKVFLTDLGMLCYLAGLKDPEHARSGPMGGVILENAVLMEIVKTFTHRGQEPRIYFWRTAAGSEVDFVLDLGNRLVPIEVKLSTTPRPRMARSIEQFQKSFGSRALKGYVIHPGDVHLPLAPGVEALPFAGL